MKILFAGFEGKNNTSKLLLDKLNVADKLYLKNHKVISCQQLFEKLENSNFDVLFLFGQKPLLKNKISIELVAKNDNQRILTNFDYKQFGSKLENTGIDYYYSENAGTSYCNNIYYFALKHIKQKNVKVIFIHLPFKNNFHNINKLIEFFNKYE